MTPLDTKFESLIYYNMATAMRWKKTRITMADLLAQNSQTEPAPLDRIDRHLIIATKYLRA
jgi:hypothetical protein